MFFNKTVFILGAGASWHYGYPTGEDLVRKVIAKAQVASEYFQDAMTNASASVSRPQYVARRSPMSMPDGLAGARKDWDSASKECDDLVRRLNSVDPLVIDYFLGQNPHLADIGKLMIAWVLLECEAFYLRYEFNLNRREALLRSHR